ncbi:hypothetical protein DL93DRAFT_1560439 [Clavulina sp. PMI_390]|nr:hypothetical protein DL93DRAFT_1560439 [Clavulina sp. PMI_390]
MDRQKTPVCLTEGNGILLWATYRQCARSGGLNFIDRLPVEVLTEIFLWHSACCSVHVIRLLLTCRRWWTVLMNTPYFWSLIHWDMRLPDQGISRVTTFLARSGEVPLSFFITAHNKLSGPRFRQAASMFSPFEGYLYRVHNITFDITRDQALLRAWFPLLESFGNLKYIEIFQQRFRANELSPFNASLIEHSQLRQLRSLTIPHPPPPLPRALDNVNRDTLHELHLGVSESSIFTHLREFQQITSLTLEFISFSGTLDTNAMECPNLRYLRVTGFIQEYLPLGLPRSFPILETLIFEGTSQPTYREPRSSTSQMNSDHILSNLRI